MAMLGAALLTAGCAVGPNYRGAPTPALPPAYAGAALIPPAPGAGTAGTATADAADAGAWWRQFGDAELDALIERALRQNLELLAAGSRVRQAREQLRIAGAARLPQLNADAGIDAIHISQNSGFSEFANLFAGSASKGGNSALAVPGTSLTTYSVGFDAAWELDLFGGARRGIEAAGASAEQALWIRRDSEVSLAAEVANDYWLLRSLQGQSGLAHEEVARQEHLLALLQARRQFGFVTEREVRSQAAQLAAAQAALPDLDAAREALVHALGVLTGGAPASRATELSASRAMPPPPPTIPVGLPSDLLRRRPDIRAAERAVAASSARIGVAVADFYPKLDLTGAFDLVSLDLRHLLEASSRQYNGAAALSWPIFAAGRTRANIRLNQEVNEQALYAYQQTVLNGLREVEDALTRYGDERRKNGALREALDGAQNATEIALAQQQAGLIDAGPVLASQGAMLQARNQLTQSDAALDRDWVALYKALGGGWDPAGSR